MVVLRKETGMTIIDANLCDLLSKISHADRSGSGCSAGDDPGKILRDALLRAEMIMVAAPSKERK